MSVFRFSLCLLFLSFISSQSSFSSENFEGNTEEKIYVKADELWISDSGIFVNHKNIAMPVHAIFFDSDGLFFSVKQGEKKKKTCPNGHESVAYWGGCAVVTCRYYAYGGIGD